MLLGAFPVSAATNLIDVQGTVYEKAVSLLEELNVVNGYPDGTFGYDRAVTRAEFAVMLARLLNLSGSADAGYEDVPSDYWAANEIALLTDFGAINGTGESTFEPEGNITFAQAVKMLVIAAGYGEYALQNGGYPYGYIMVGNDCGLLAGISAGEAEMMSRGQLALMLYNATEVDVMELVSAGSQLQYQAREGNTILVKYHDIYRVDGLITATYRSGLDGSAVSPGRIRIEDTLYLLDANAEEVNDLLGFMVEAYYRMPVEGGDMTVFYAYKSERQNNTLEIRCEDIVSFEGNRLSYINPATQRTASVRIEPSAYVLVNGENKPSYTEADFMRDAGTVTLVEHKGNGYRFVSIKGYDNYLVTSVSDEKIYNKYRPEKVFEVETGENKKRYTLHDAYGQEITPDKITENDVISVMEAPSGEYYDITWIADRASGTLDEMEKNGDRINYVVGGRTVALSKSLIDAMAADLVKEPVIGEPIVLSLDVEGKAAGLEAGTTVDGDMALLVNAHQETAGVDKKIKLNLLSDSNKELQLDMAEKVRHVYDGVIDTIPDVRMLEILKNGGELVERQVVIYKQNSQGEIVQLETAVPQAEQTDPNSLYRFDIDGKLYKTAPMSFEGTASVNESTVVFMHPEDDSRDLSENYDVRSPLSFTNDVRYAVTAYAKGKNTIPLLALTTPIETKIADDSSLFLVDKISSVANAEGDTVKKLYGMQAGAAADATLKDDTVYQNAKLIGSGTPVQIAQGDVIRLSRDNQNNVINIEVVLDYDASGDLPWGTDPAKTNVYNGYTHAAHMVYGPVELRDEGLIKIKLSDTSSEIHKVDKVKIMMFDSTVRENKLRVATIDDIMDMNTPDASKVLLRSRYGEVRDLIIFK